MSRPLADRPKGRLAPVKIADQCGQRAFMTEKRMVVRFGGAAHAIGQSRALKAKTVHCSRHGAGYQRHSPLPCAKPLLAAFGTSILTPSPPAAVHRGRLADLDEAAQPSIPLWLERPASIVAFTPQPRAGWDRTGASTKSRSPRPRSSLTATARPIFRKPIETKEINGLGQEPRFRGSVYPRPVESDPPRNYVSETANLPHGSIDMPKYFFHLHHERSVYDHIGEDLPDRHAAWNEAAIAAGHIMRDLEKKLKSGQDWHLEVTDEFANALYIIHVRAETPS
jgi:hypothetical protein